MITHTLSESLYIRRDARIRAHSFEGIRDVVENVQVFEDRADLVAPHIAPAGRTREEVARSHDCGIRVRQAINARNNLITVAS